MESEELRFKHVGISSDGAVIFCEMDNGKTYAMPLRALERAEVWNSEAKPKAIGIIHDGYAALVKFDTGVQIDFPSDFVLHICEPSYGWHKDKGRAISGVGGRIREIRLARGLTLDELAAKCGIAKPNLSRLENGKVTPTIETVGTIAAALDTHPALLLATKKPERAWTWTQHAFDKWKRDLIWKPGLHLNNVRGVDMVKAFIATRPEHGYARKKLLEYAIYAPPHARDIPEYALDAEKWAREVAAASRQGVDASAYRLVAAPRKRQDHGR
jgi:transcriptional regulator with XRE-family HTH domain